MTTQNLIQKTLVELWQNRNAKTTPNLQQDIIGKITTSFTSSGSIDFSFYCLVDLTDLSFIYVGGEFCKYLKHTSWINKSISILFECSTASEQTFFSESFKTAHHFYNSNAVLKPDYFRYSYTVNFKNNKDGMQLFLVHVYFIKFDSNNQPVFAICTFSLISGLIDTTRQYWISNFNPLTKSYEVVYHQKLKNEQIQLSSRERQLIKLIIAGKKNNEICDEMKITNHSLRTYKCNILKKNEHSNMTSLLAQINTLL